MIKVGFILSPKKLKKLGLPNVITEDPYCQNHVEVTLLDPYKTLSEQGGPFHLIIHKLNEVSGFCCTNSENCWRKEGLLEYLLDEISLNETILVDPLSSVELLQNRELTLKVISSLEIHGEDHDVKVPKWCVVRNTFDSRESFKQWMNENELKFPIIVKSLESQGVMKRFTMEIHFNDKELFIDGALNLGIFPCLAQNFINHDGVIYKIYVIGKYFCIIQRPSFNNFDQTSKSELNTLRFKTNDLNCVGKTEQSFLTDHIKTNLKYKVVDGISERIVAKIVDSVKDKLKCNLIGIDVIIDSQSGDYCIIDVNYLPSYAGVPNFGRHLFDLFNSLIKKEFKDD